MNIRAVSRRLGATSLVLLMAALFACEGADQDPGTISPVPRKVSTREGSQILFGDLHIHTTYSMDAFFTSMPLVTGEGAHPPADACDYARHCAALDFFSITDHAMELTPAHWALEKEANRRCNAVAGDPESPDLVAFHGWEWTHVGRTPETHWGHKNVIFRDLGEDEVPLRPISAMGPETVNPWMERAPGMARAGLIDPLNAGQYADFGWLVSEIQNVPRCEPDVHTRELPADCHENAPTPDVLFRKLDEWGFDALVIPHGTAWGSYSPPGTAWDKQLTPSMHDPTRQKLIEVMSGHGNSEQYRSWREFEVGAAGERICPAPTADYLPCCWQAGEIMRARCGDLPEAECEERVEEAKRYTLSAGVAPDLVLPGTGYEDWLDCGQDRRAFKPAYGLRPRGTVQYALALSRDSETRATESEADKTGSNELIAASSDAAIQDEPPASSDPLRFRFGFIASSDSHSGRPATGFKQSGPLGGRTDIIGPRNTFYAKLLTGRGEPEDPRRAQPAPLATASPLTAERMSSFLYPGGTVAVHSAGRDRDSIWNALESRATYGTSGPRMLLWFDLLEGEARHPMGSEVEHASTPRFEVRAAGAFIQKPGCPQDAVAALGEERVRTLCQGECYHPTDERHPIERIEVVRIRPQSSSDETITSLVEDPWRTLPCEPDSEGCVVQFEDPDFAGSGRDALYYVRALQTPTSAVNGANLRTRFEDGRPVEVRPCFVGGRIPEEGDCRGEVQERAWSSPIFVDQKS
jgi:hypothetical protein